jgi:hypothetical protein
VIIAGRMIARRAYLRWRSSFVYQSAMHGAVPDSPLNAESFDQLIAQGQAIAGSVENGERLPSQENRN